MLSIAFFAHRGCQHRFPEHRPNARTTSTTLERMDSSPRTDRVSLCAPVGKMALATTAVLKAGAAVYLIWRTSVPEASLKNTVHMLVSAQQLKSHEASGHGPGTIARREKAKAVARAARVAASLDYRCQRLVPLARCTASSKSVTSMSRVRPTLLARKFSTVAAKVRLKSLACSCLQVQWNRGAVWTAHHAGPKGRRSWA